MFPTLGFGARLRDGKVHHCFALNGNDAAPDCHGIVNVVQAYHQALANVTLYGPTHFAPIIDHVAACVWDLGVVE